MNFYGQLFKTILFLSMLILIGWGIYLGFNFMEAQFVQLSPANRASLSIITVLTLTFCFIISWAIYTGASRASKVIQPERRIAYDMFMEFFIEGEAILREANENEYQLKLSFLKQNMVLWASEKVLKAFIKWTELLNDENRDKKLFVEQGEKVLLLIRKDINKDRVPLKTGELNSLFHKKK